MVGDIEVWSGTPDDLAAFDAIRSFVRACPIPHIAPGSYSDRQKGNLGETIAFLCGQHSPELATRDHLFAPNATNPLKGISATDVDLCWCFFDPDDERRDRIVMQEVKTTGDRQSAKYIRDLERDYEALFGTDLEFTLASRILGFATRLDIERGRTDLARRVGRLSAHTPSSAKRVYLAPTAIHDKSASDWYTQLEAVRITLVQDFGWSAGQVRPVAVGLEDIDVQLRRISVIP